MAGDNNNDDDDDDVEKEGGSDGTLKSSIQAGFEVTLTWPTGGNPRGAPDSIVPEEAGDREESRSRRGQGRCALLR